MRKLKGQEQFLLWKQKFNIIADSKLANEHLMLVMNVEYFQQSDLL
jgi:hypothetical protein